MLNVCPNCGAALPQNAKACPECGADEETGWSDSAYANHLGIPDEHFDHEKFVEEEFGEKPVKPVGLRWFWWITAVLLLLAFIFFCLH